MRFSFRYVLALALVLPLLPGCDAVDEGDDYLAGSWTLDEVIADGDPYTALTGALYEQVVFTFFEETATFRIFADVEGTPDDIEVTGSYRLDKEDDELLLVPSVAAPSLLDVDLVDGRRVVLRSGTAVPLLRTLFGIVSYGGTDDVFLVMRREL